MYEDQELSLRELVQILKRGLPFAMAVALGAAAATYMLSMRIVPDYQSSSTLLVSRPNSALQGSFGVSLVTAPVIDVSAYRAAATSSPVLLDALASLGLSEPTAAQIRHFESLITVRADNAQQSSLIHVSVRNADPEAASEAANAVAHALLRWDEQRAKHNLSTVVETLESQIQSFDAELSNDAEAIEQREGLRTLRGERITQLNAAKALLTSAVGLLEVLEPATPSLEPVSPNPTRNAVLAFALGMFVVYGFVLLREALDTRFRGGDDLVRATQLPVLGEFPRMAPGTRLLPKEAAGYLRTNVNFATSTSHPKVLLVTSAGKEQGKTSVASSLAESYVRNDYRTLLIDGDLRKPTVATVFGLTRSAGSSAAPTLSMGELLENPDASGFPVHVDLDGGQLHILPQFGVAHSPAELLARGFSAVLNRFKPEYDVIIIDSPPMLPVADGLTMAPHTTGVIFAVSLPNTDRRAVVAGLDLLERIGVRVLGVVATNMERNAGVNGNFGYGYGYGYGYGQPSPHRPEDPQGPSGGATNPVPTSRARPGATASPSATVPSSWWARFWPNH